MRKSSSTAPEPGPLEAERPEATRAVTRGARRLLRAAGYAVLTEAALPGGRRADLVALSNDGALRIVEVKSCLADFRADRKWLHYRDHCDYFYFAIPPDLPPDAFPGEAGLIVADAYGGFMEREAQPHRLAPASRRAMLVRFGALAAERLHALGREDEFD